MNNSELEIALFDLLILQSLNIESKFNTDTYNIKTILRRETISYTIDSSKESSIIQKEVRELLREYIYNLLDLLLN